MMNLYVTAASRVGCVRKNNEDMILVGSSFIRNDSFNTKIELAPGKRTILAVADGMGGHNSGEVASSDALHNLHFFFNDIPTGLTAGEFNEMMVVWLESINLIVESKGRNDDRFKGMGTTLVGIAYYGGDFFSMNCGDSRLYRLRNGLLEQLTTDHSLNNMLGSTKHSSIITNCIGGGNKNSYMDIVKMTDDIQLSDIYLLCSDGLSDMLNDQQIEILLKSGGDADALCQAAVEAGGFDNVSACVIEVKSE
jgi:protein phosphatase